MCFYLHYSDSCSDPAGKVAESVTPVDTTDGVTTDAETAVTSEGDEDSESMSESDSSEEESSESEEETEEDDTTSQTTGTVNLPLFVHYF